MRTGFSMVSVGVAVAVWSSTAAASLREASGEEPPADEQETDEAAEPLTPAQAQQTCN